LSTLTSLIFLRILFYIQILNFHLRTLRNNFKERLQRVLNNAPSLGNVDARPFNPREVIFFRKIYTMIRKMSQHFNRAMGLVITFIIVLSWFIITINGYKMFMISSAESMAEFKSELNFNFKFFYNLFFSEIFSRVMIFLVGTVTVFYSCQMSLFIVSYLDFSFHVKHNLSLLIFSKWTYWISHTRLSIVKVTQLLALCFRSSISKFDDRALSLKSSDYTQSIIDCWFR
jgi:hypothetical protein